ncbi:MAG: HEAT repeat domain-containing protein [Myxococcota bacterium]
MAEDNAESISLQDLQINLCLEDINSPDSLVRQFAITQLQNFTGNKTVISALEARRKIEENIECLNDLNEILSLSTPGNSQVSISEIDRPQTTDEIIGLWNTIPPAQLGELVKQVKNFEVDEQIKVCCEILCRQFSAAQIIPILSLSRKVMMNERVINCLEKLLNTQSSLLLARIVALLTRLKPAKLIAHLPRLLINKNLQVRLAAIKALYLLSKPEAIRLLTELMFSKNTSNRQYAFSFLFLLPFSDTGDIVLRLIEQADLPKSLDRIIRYLIYNNPDQVFFRRITISYLLHGRRIAALKSYCLLAAKSLVVSGLVKKSSKELISESQEAAKKFILRHRSQQAAELEQKKFEISESHHNTELENLSKIPDFSQEQIAKLLYVCHSLTKTEEISAAIRLINKHQLGTDAFCLWLESLLSSDSVEVVCLAIDSLLQLNKKRIWAHLSVLVFHKDPMVAEKSLKIFNREFPEKLLDKLKLWIKDDDSKIRAVAYKGLLETEFLQARELILDFLKSSSNLELIKYFGSILVLNPDRLTVYKLKDLSTKCPDKKRKLLIQLAGEIDSELGVNEENPGALQAIIDEVGLREQWEDILLKIKRISYDNQSPDFGDLIRSKSFNIVLVGLVFFAFLLFFFQFRLSAPTKKITSQGNQEKTVYSYSPGKETEPATEYSTSHPWDYQLPELATPPSSLYNTLSEEELVALHENLIKETGSSVLEFPLDDYKIYLEERFPNE